MPESKMEAVAAMIGAPMNVNIWIDFHDDRDRDESRARDRWRFTKSGLAYISGDGSVWIGGESYEVLHKLITGEASIAPIPWVPKVGDRYWSLNFDAAASLFLWRNAHADMCNWRDGNVYPTEDAAHAAIEYHKERDRQTLAEIEALRKQAHP